MDSPRLAEHGAEGQREAGHQGPGPGRADVREGVDAGQAGVEAEEDDAGVGQHAADDDQVVELRTRHLDVALIAVLDVEGQEDRRHYDAADGQRGQRCVHRLVHSGVLDDQQRSVLWRVPETER